MRISKCEKYKDIITELYNKGFSARDVSELLPEKIFYTTILAYLKKIHIGIRPIGYRGEGKIGGLFKKGHNNGFKKGNQPWNKKEITWEVNENGCWICTSHKTNKGYPMLSDNRILSRVIYEKNKGKIPKGMLVCHECDTPSCINPSHLFLGTNIYNMKDKCSKDRQSKGEKIKTSKLTEREVNEIKYGCHEKSHREIAEAYKVSPTTITNIKNNKSWKHVKEDLLCQ